jgi:hypothetical protein
MWRVKVNSKMSSVGEVRSIGGWGEVKVEEVVDVEEEEVEEEVEDGVGTEMVEVGFGGR